MDNDKKVGLTLKSDHKDDTKSPELIAANVTSQSHKSIEKEMAEFELVELNENLDANVRVNLKLDRDRRRSIQPHTAADLAVVSAQSSQHCLRY